MPLKIRRVQVWTGEIPDLLGAAASILERLARNAIDLEFVFTRPHPTNPEAGLIFLAPIVGSEQMKIARSVGLTPADEQSILYLQGPNIPGVGFSIMRELAIAGVPLQGISISAVENLFAAYLAFYNHVDAGKAVQVLAILDVD